MLDEHRVLQLKGKSGGSMSLEVNFSDSKAVKECKVVRVKVGDKTVDISRDELISVMLLIGSASDQKKMIPTKLTTIHKMERLLTFEFTAKRDYKAGEVIAVQAPWIDEVPNVEEVLAGNIGRHKTYDKRYDKLTKL